MHVKLSYFIGKARKAAVLWTVYCLLRIVEEWYEAFQSVHSGINLELLQNDTGI